MRLTDLPTILQARLIERIKLEMESWERSRVWWHKGESAPAREMILWNEAFKKFAAAVANNEPIEAAFLEWSGQDPEACDTNKINVPQMSIHDIYKDARRVLAELAAPITTAEQANEASEEMIDRLNQEGKQP
jgi:hypothetical protein